MHRIMYQDVKVQFSIYIITYAITWANATGAMASFVVFRHLVNSGNRVVDERCVSILSRLFHGGCI